MEDVILRACARVAPVWPLDRFIAVNPFWGMIDEPLRDVAATLRTLSGAELLMPRAWYRQAHREGRLGETHLAEALARAPSPLSVADLEALLETDEAPPSVRARVVDVLDAERDLTREISWRSFVTHSVGQLCAAYFDDGQASTGPHRAGGLYACWRRAAAGDRSPRLTMGFDGYRALVSELPASTSELFAKALADLEVPSEERERYLWSLLLDQNGWASWCAYRRWTARLAGGDDDEIRDLLAIRLAWEWLLLRSGGDRTRQRWRHAIASWSRAGSGARTDDWLLQAAMETAWRAPVVAALSAGFRASRPASPPFQAVFCIDVRSEIFRRALETTIPSAQTLGFAGFFGLPVEYLPACATRARPHLPGLLAPALRVTDDGLAPGAIDRLARHVAHEDAARALKSDALGTFTAVEALGLGYAWHLAAESLGLARSTEPAARPRLTARAGGGALETSARADLAAGMLRAMSLTRDFARLVMLAGHGSSTRNNPHAAGLDCGACGGQTGEVNARAAAALLNDADVRAALRERGIEIPGETWFLAGLHDTTTDDFTLFDLDEAPPTHRDAIAALEAHLRDAGSLARAERAAQPLAEGDVRRRGRDWAEVRPEWGLANNAAFIVAPRERSRHLTLGGRAFLHDYRAEEDEGYRVLELIMTAPMVVTHWINFQYYASTVDNERYGSGNKVLHNVVGGHLGVFEGNGGDLRIGLPLQSLHDGERWVHTPLRLSVFIEAPRAAIDAVIARHEIVRSLVDHEWLALFQLDREEEAVYARRATEWEKETGRC
ncbi:MAG: DUF2309 domain-containing protein [Labilithrix sp.]